MPPAPHPSFSLSHPNNPFLQPLTWEVLGRSEKLAEPGSTEVILLSNRESQQVVNLYSGGLDEML